MGLIIEKLTGEYYRLNDLGIFERERLQISSPNIKQETTEIQGMNGVHSGPTYLRERPLKASLVSLVDEFPEMSEQRRQIFKIFDAREFFYLSEERDPSLRWLVKCTSPFSIQEIATIGNFDVDFTSFSPFCQTVNIVERRFNQPMFFFNNQGTEAINMKEQMETEIIFIGASDELSIENKTTGTIWKYNGTTSPGDVILLKGIGATKNGDSIFGETNFKLISFTPGYNDFEIKGAAEGFQLIVRTRFYFI